MSDPGDAERWIGPSAQNLAEFFVGGAERSGVRTVRWEDAQAADPGLPDSIANSVTLLCPMTAGTAPELTARLDAFFGGADGGDWILWSAWPTPDLTRLGYTLIGHPPLMVRLPGGEPPAIPAELHVDEVGDEEALAEFELTFINGYPLKEMQPARAGQLFLPGALGGPTRFWVGYLVDQPVTVAASCEHDGLVGIYCVATLPEARGRGYGAAVTDRAARANANLPAVLQSSDLGRPVYERLGFATVSRYTLWTRARRH